MTAPQPPAVSRLRKLGNSRVQACSQLAMLESLLITLIPVNKLARLAAMSINFVRTKSRI